MRRAKDKERSSLFIAFFIAVGIYALVGVCVYAVIINIKDYKILSQKAYYLSLSHFVSNISSETSPQEQQKAEDSITNELQKTKSNAQHNKKPPKPQTHSQSIPQATSAPSSQVEDSDSNDEYARRIYALIAESYAYPLSFKNRGIKGEIKLHFEIDEDGRLHNVKILKSSHFESLDKLALKNLQKASHSFPRPFRHREMIITLGYGTKNIE